MCDELAINESDFIRRAIADAARTHNDPSIPNDNFRYIQPIGWIGLHLKYLSQIRQCQLKHKKSLNHLYRGSVSDNYQNFHQFRVCDGHYEGAYLAFLLWGIVIDTPNNRVCIAESESLHCVSLFVVRDSSLQQSVIQTWVRQPFLH